MTTSQHTDFCNHAEGSGKFSGAFFIFLLITFPILLFSCKAVPFTEMEQGDFCPEQIEWTKINDGVSSFNFSSKTNALSWYAAKIRLDDESCTPLFCPGNEKPELMKVLKFAELSKADIAFNTTPITSKGQPVGLVIANGKTLSRPNDKYSAFALRKTQAGWKAELFKLQSECENSAPDIAFGGFWINLDNNNIVEFARIRDKRTCCGISEDGRTLFVLAVNTPGLTYMECAQIMQKLGANDAIEFDGGSSTDIFISNAPSRFLFTRKVSCIMGFRF